MHKLKSITTKFKNGFTAVRGHIGKVFTGDRFARAMNALTTVAFIVGLLALALLVWLQLRPIKTANIKVPVATDQASYSPGEEISGIFFGDIYYTGEVRSLREVFCKDYKGIIKPPPQNADGDFFSTQSRPLHLEGLTFLVGNLPENIPVGSNCVLQFTNIYKIPTPFGTRHLEYQYYTQNFAIVSDERRDQLECEATGRKDCDLTSDNRSTQTEVAPGIQEAPEAPQPTPIVNNDNSTTNNITNPPASQEPAPQTVEKCTVDFIVKIGCRQVVPNE